MKPTVPDGLRASFHKRQSGKRALASQKEAGISPLRIALVAPSVVRVVGETRSRSPSSTIDASRRAFRTPVLDHAATKVRATGRSPYSGNNGARQPLFFHIADGGQFEFLAEFLTQVRESAVPSVDTGICQSAAISMCGQFRQTCSPRWLNRLPRRAGKAGRFRFVHQLRILRVFSCFGRKNSSKWRWQFKRGPPWQPKTSVLAV